MSLTIAIAFGAVFTIISIGVGVYLLRYRDSITEMMGMMIGMTMGMMSGIAVGFYIGVATDMFISNLVGVVVGVAFGAGFGRSGGLMGAMDGSMGGFMGGMMGAMLGVMINISPLAVWVTTAFTTVICLVMYIGLIRLVRQQPSNTPKIRFATKWSTSLTAKLTSDYHGERCISSPPAASEPSTRILSAIWCSRCARARRLKAWDAVLRGGARQRGP